MLQEFSFTQILRSCLVWGSQEVDYLAECNMIESQLDFGLPLTATRPGLVLRSRLFALFKIGPFLSLLFFQFKTLANGAEW